MTTLRAEAPSATRVRDVALGVSGVAFALLLIPVVAIPHASLDYPTTSPPASHVFTAFFREHRVVEESQALLHSLAAVVLLVFFAALAGHVRRAGNDLAARLTLAAGSGVAVIMLVTMMLVAGSISLSGGVDGQVQGWIYSLGWWEHFKCAYLLPVALVPACRVLRTARVLPAPLAWTGQVLGLLGLAAMIGGLSSSTEFLMFPVFFLLIIWVLATGVVALTRGVGTRHDETLEPVGQPA
jgi:hypothetical protein